MSRLPAPVGHVLLLFAPKALPLRSRYYINIDIGVEAQGMQTAPHIVIVEDEAIQRQLLVTFLTTQGFRVTEFDRGAGLRALLERELPDLVLLDVRLPGEDGFSLARHCRERGPQIGVVMVTAAGETVDRVQGLESGADDYLAKPFEPRELLARMRSVLRRVRTPAAPRASRVRMGRRVLDLELRVLCDDAADGAEEKLTAGEFELLRAFAANPHRPLERDWLMQVTSHRERSAVDRTIDLRVARLRRKIENNPADPQAIRTVRGVGYMFVPEGS
jgi:DNA-binding response OmpR family regulator